MTRCKTPPTSLVLRVYRRNVRSLLSMVCMLISFYTSSNYPQPSSLSPILHDPYPRCLNLSHRSLPQYLFDRNPVSRRPPVPSVSPQTRPATPVTGLTGHGSLVPLPSFPLSLPDFPHPAVQGVLELPVTFPSVNDSRSPPKTRPFPALDYIKNLPSKTDDSIL